MRKLWIGLGTFVALAAVVLVGGWVALRRGDIPYAVLERTYGDTQSRYVDLPGRVHMHFRDQGARDGAPLVLLHGYAASLHAWEPWVARLGDRLRLVTIDLPGHGLTRVPPGYRASIEQYVAEVEEFARARQLARFTVVGSSMGGNVAWQYALAHPERVEALVLVDASGWPDAGAGAHGSFVFTLLRVPVLRLMLRDLDGTRLVRQGLEAAFADPRRVDDAMVRRYTELARAPGHRDILLDMGDRHARQQATNERLAAIRVPTLILQGEQDRLVPAEHARRFAAAITGSKLVLWPDDGHLPMEEHPDRSAEVVASFLASAR
jgi:pimeloyl-ACP methyl ester carboxylesterase